MIFFSSENPMDVHTCNTKNRSQCLSYIFDGFWNTNYFAHSCHNDLVPVPKFCTSMTFIALACV